MLLRFEAIDVDGQLALAGESGPVHALPIPRKGLTESIHDGPSVVTAQFAIRIGTALAEDRDYVVEPLANLDRYCNSVQPWGLSHALQVREIAT